MRHFRLNFAKRIIAYCDRTTESIKDKSWSMNDSFKSKVDDIEQRPSEPLSGSKYSNALKNFDEKHIRINDTKFIKEKIDELKKELRNCLEQEANHRRINGELSLSKDEYEKSVLKSALYIETLDRLENMNFDPKKDGSQDIEVMVNNLYDKAIYYADNTVSEMQKEPKYSALLKSLREGKRTYASNGQIKEDLEYMEAGTRLENEFGANISTVSKAPEKDAPVAQQPQKGSPKKVTTMVKN